MSHKIIGIERKVLDHGIIRVLDVMGNDTAVTDSARISYGQHGAGKTDAENRNLLRYMMMHSHTSPFEMCEIKLYVKAPMFVVRQWVRHRTANFNEYSARYSEMSDEFYYPTYEMMQKQSSSNKQCSEGLFTHEEYEDIVGKMKQSCDFAYNEYQNMLAHGVARETARCILPVNIYTQFYWKIDAHNLMRFLYLRCEENAQKEIRAYAHEILDIFAQWMPVTHEAFMDYVVNSERYSNNVMNLLKASLDQEKMLDLLGESNDISKREKDYTRKTLIG